MSNRTRIISATLGAALLLPLGGCGGDPADVSGDFSVALTNRENGCNFENFTVGDSSSNIPVVITQDGEAASATVNGVAGGLLDLWLGARVFTGEVDGDDLLLTLFGERSYTQGNCSFTYNAELDASLSGNALAGNIRYRAATNGNPDCAALEGCVTRQEMSGTRPPK